MSATQLSVHNAQVRFVCPTKDKGASGSMNINQLASHGTLGAVDRYLLFAFIQVFNVKNGIPSRKGRPFAQNPPVGVQ
jgi:hypothetical protein